MSQEYKEEQAGQEFAREFSSFVNNMSGGPRKVAVAQLLRDHRTLQQGHMRFVMQFVEGMAEQNSDLRNEASVNLAKAIMEIDPQVRALPKI